MTSVRFITQETIFAEREDVRECPCFNNLHYPFTRGTFLSHALEIKHVELVCMQASARARIYFRMSTRSAKSFLLSSA